MPLTTKLLVAFAAMVLTAGTIWLAYVLWLELPWLTANDTVKMLAPLVTVIFLAIAGFQHRKRVK